MCYPFIVDVDLDGRLMSLSVLRAAGEEVPDNELVDLSLISLPPASTHIKSGLHAAYIYRCAKFEHQVKI